MHAWTGLDLTLLAIAGYVAVVALVRLMLAYRQRALVRLQAEVEAQQRAKAAAALAEQTKRRAA